MVVDCLLQVPGYLLPDLAGQEKLYDAQHRPHHHYGRNQGRQQPQEHQVQRAVGRKQGRVEYLLDQHGANHAQPGVDHDDQAHDGYGQLVRAKQPHDPARQPKVAAAVQSPVVVRVALLRHGGSPVPWPFQRGRPARTGSDDSTGTMLPSLYTTPSSQ